jgi:transposase InsO family protein
MFMPLVQGYRYIVQARCSLISWPEWRKLKKENGRTLGAFIFEEILCRWGGLEEIVTDNGPAMLAALEWLSEKYHINHIRISAYNSKANGIVERSHRTIRDSIVKACDGDITRWVNMASYTFWADRVTTRKATGYSPFHMGHGVEPLLPFDITEATFMLPPITAKLSTSDLIGLRARQLAKRDEDLAKIHDNVVKSRFASISEFEKQFKNSIHDYNFQPGDLALVLNKKIEPESNAKCKPRYFGPSTLQCPT